MLHAIDVASKNENAAIHILSTDTDVLIFALAYPCSSLFSKTWSELMYVNWSWEEQEIDCTETNLWCLRLPPCQRLIGFHSFTGCHTIGRFSGKGNITCWKSFKNFKDWQDHCSGVHWSWTGKHAIWSSNLTTLERYICQLYIPVVLGGCCSRKIKQSVKSSPQLKLLYTRTYSVPITRPEYGIWFTSRIQYLPHGWTNEEGCLFPGRTLLKPAPDAVIELIHCKWAKSKCRNSMCSVSCRKASLVCTKLCQCGLDAGDCDNVRCIAVLDEENEEDIWVIMPFSMTLVFIQDKIKETLSTYVFLQ